MRWIEEGSRGDSNGWGIAPFGSGGALRRRQATTTGRREAEMACVWHAWALGMHGGGLGGGGRPAGDGQNRREGAVDVTTHEDVTNLQPPTTSATWNPPAQLTSTWHR